MTTNVYFQHLSHYDHLGPSYADYYVLLNMPITWFSLCPCNGSQTINAPDSLVVVPTDELIQFWDRSHTSICMLCTPISFPIFTNFYTFFVDYRCCHPNTSSNCNSKACLTIYHVDYNCLPSFIPVCLSVVQISIPIFAIYTQKFPFLPKMCYF